VALSGNTLVVGAEGTNANAGVSYIYSHATSGWPTTPTAALSDPVATANDQFGDMVAIDNTTIMVGAAAPSSAIGAAYIYLMSKKTGWPTMPTVSLHDPGAAATDNFGAGGGVAVLGTNALVGAWGTNSSAGAAFGYVKGSWGWPTTPTFSLHDPGATANDAFGSGVALGTDLAIVGAPGSSSGGAAFLYIQGASGWPAVPTLTLHDPGATSGDLFGSGYAVAVSDKVAVIGAYGASAQAGVAYIYQV
jgi:hypothetical protein